MMIRINNSLYPVFPSDNGLASHRSSNRRALVAGSKQQAAARDLAPVPWLCQDMVF